jgi:geranylgeranyl pyrophosphate synthase
MIESLKKYAMELGYVFQLRDDWLGEYGDSDKTGKPVGNDSREGKHTYATMNGKDKTEAAINEHMELAKKWGLSLQGSSSQGRILAELVEWMGTRES